MSLSSIATEGFLTGGSLSLVATSGFLGGDIKKGFVEIIRFVLNIYKKVGFTVER